MRAVQRVGNDFCHHFRRVEHAFFADGVRAELKQNGVRRKILVIGALADENILYQTGILFVCHGFDLLGEFPVDRAVLIGASHQQANPRRVFAVDAACVFVLIGNAVAMNVDNRVRPFLQKAFGSLPAPPIRAGIMRQMGGFVENHVDPLLLQSVSEIARHIVYAALPVDALRSVGGHIAFVAVGDVHCNQLAGIVGLCVGSGHGDFRRKDGLRFADLQPRNIRHGFFTDFFCDGVAVLHRCNAVENVVGTDIFVAFADFAADGKQICARSVYRDMQRFG